MLTRAITPILLLSSLTVASAAQDKDASVTERLDKLEKVVNSLQARKAELECRSFVTPGGKSNDFTAHQVRPADLGPEWKLVGGGCAMVGWMDYWQPFLLDVTPIVDGTEATSFGCWGKNPQPMSVRASATFCRAVWK